MDLLARRRVNLGIRNSETNIVITRAALSPVPESIIQTTQAVYNTPLSSLVGWNIRQNLRLGRGDATRRCRDDLGITIGVRKTCGPPDVLTSLNTSMEVQRLSVNQVDVRL